MVQQENRRNTLFQKEKNKKKRGGEITDSEQVQNLKAHWNGDPAFQTYRSGSPVPMALPGTACFAALIG